MTAQRITDWQFWNGLVCARLPLRLLIEPERVRTRKQMKQLSASAYVFRIFDLFFFALRDPAIVERLGSDERASIRDFVTAFDSLRWSPISTHPHIRELADDSYTALAPLAKRVDRFLWLRTGRDPVAVLYRLVRGWPLFESSLKAKEKVNQSIQTNALDHT